MDQGKGCKSVRVQAAQLASQAQQAVQTAQQSEAQGQLIEQTRQEAIGHVENARQVVGATQQRANHCQSRAYHSWIVPGKFCDASTTW